MTYLDLTLPSAVENLALDEALLLAAEQEGGEVLRVWEWPWPTVVLGAAGRLADDVDEAACIRDNIPILRRASGGGTVLLARGCLLFTLVLHYDRAAELTQIPSSYQFILGRIAQALGVSLAGTSDLTLDSRKISGNAQQRKRRHLLHHGTLLYDFRAEQVGRYLRLPSRQPDYRRHRDHLDFLTNLPMTAMEMKARLRQAWDATESSQARPEEMVRTLVSDKYARNEWLRRR
jgi:lipoate-protein ligase A